ncbi:MAG: RnfABCDGE type electron transport complex subunit D [Brevinema sp.]
MHKVFDKVYDSAPFIHNKLSSPYIYLAYLRALTLLSIGAAIHYGYIFFLHFLTTYLIAFIIVWCYQFFKKSVLFNTEYWQISTLTYILCLPPSLSIGSSILGIIVLFFLGSHIFFVNEKFIVNPILIGVIGAYFFNFNYYNEVFVLPLPYLIKSIFSSDLSFIEIFLNANQMIMDNLAGFSIQDSIGLYSDTISLWWFLSSPISPWFGTGSIALLLIVYLFLSITKTINPIPTLLYIIGYLSLTVVLQLTQQQPIDILSLLSDGALWFCAVLLVSNSISLPSTLKGICMFALTASWITALLNFRQALVINYIFALIITNMGSSLIGYIFQVTPFSVKKSSTEIPSLNLPIRFRLFTGILLIVTVLLLTHTLFQYSLLEREQNYYKTVVQQFFPEDIIQQSKDQPLIYHIADSDTPTIIYSSATLYRASADLLLIVSNDTITEIEIIKLQTAHTYYNNIEWLELLIGIDINELPSFLQSNQKQIVYQRNPLIIKVLQNALLQGRDIYKQSQKGEE